MADFYCDPTLPQAGTLLYSTTPVAAGTVPVRPEDGNGRAPGPAVMATRVIDFTGQPTAGQAITVAGVTFTVVASGATGNQFNLGANAAATALNFRNAVNASTTAAVSPSFAVTCPLRNAVNATNSSAVVTLYTRIAGSEWNSITETSTLSNVTNGQWSGGQDGAWGYFFNVAAISWPTSVAAGAYGAFPGAYLGAVSPGDIIHIRSSRSGNNTTIVWPNASTTVLARAVGTLSQPLIFLADNGVMWPGETGVFTLSANMAQTVNRNLTLPTTVGLKQIWSGVKTGATSRNWRFELTGAWPVGNWLYNVGGNVSSSNNFLELHNMEVTGANGAVINNADSTYKHFQWLPPASSTASPRDVPNLICKGLYVRTANRSSFFSSSPTSTANTHVRVIDCVEDHTGATLAASDAIIGMTSIGGNLPSPGRFEFISTRFLGYPAAANLSGFQNFNSRLAHFILRDCEFENIKVFGGVANGGILGTAEDTSNPNADILKSIRIVSSVGNRPSVFENSRWAWGWFDSAAPVVSTSLLPDGVTPFSLRCAITTEVGNVTPFYPVRFPRIAKINSLADGTRTATLRILIDNAYIANLGRNPNNRELWVEISYIDTSGNIQTVSSAAGIGTVPVLLTSGTPSDWSTTSYDVNGVSHTYSPLQIAVTLPNVKSGSECGLHFYSGIQSSSIDDLIFVSPDWSIS